MICAVSMVFMGIGPVGFCFGRGTRYRGVRALMSREPAGQFGINLSFARLDFKRWSPN